MDSKNTVTQTSKGITCNNCGKVFERNDLLNMGVRPVEGLEGVLEAGVVCPSCNTFFHAEYTSTRLIKMYRDFKREKEYVKKQHLYRAYFRKNAAWQQEVSVKLLQLSMAKDLSNEQQLSGQPAEA